MREGNLKKVNKIAKMLVRMVALEGLQPVVLEGNIQCELDAVKKSMKIGNSGLP